MKKNHIISRLHQAIQKRQELLQVTNALRLVNDVGDDLPGWTLDQFGDHFQIQIYSPELWPQARQLSAWVQEALDMQYLITKNRSSASGKSLENVDTIIYNPLAWDSKVVVSEYDLQFEVDLEDQVNPGLFLDMRENRFKFRKAIQKLDTSKKGQMLNLFSYTGSFAVHCRHAGVKRAVNVDISKKILDRARRNYELNNMEVQRGEMVRESSFDYLDLCVKKGFKFNAIVLDPPTFSRWKGKVFKVERDLGELVQKCLQILEPGGKLWVSTNSSNWNNSKLSALVKQEARGLGRSGKVEFNSAQGIDFPGTGKIRPSHLSCCFFSLHF